MTEQDRGHLDYLRRVLNGALLYADINSVPVPARVRSNVLNAIHSLDEKLIPPREYPVGR